jgi:ABC-2 type transport system ATP-binding protein
MLSVISLSYYYGLVRRLDEISFTIKHGQMMGIFGHNGSGKSTLLSMLQAVLPVQHGQVYFQKENAVGDDGYIRRDLRNQMGILCQHTSSDEKLSLWHNLYYFAHLMGVSDKKIKVAKWLELAKLTDRAKEPIKNLSGGMRRRLELYRTFLHEPKLVILDEPTLGLDVGEAKRFWSFLSEYKNKTGAVVVLASHDNHGLMVCEHILMLKNGQVIKEGSPLALMGGLDFMRCFISVKQPISDLNLPWYDVKKSYDDHEISAKIPLTSLNALFHHPFFSSPHLNSLNLEHPSLVDVYEQCEQGQ